MIKKLPIFLAFLLFLLLPQEISAQIIINELYTQTTSDDWVEIYNIDSGEIDLSGYKLQDKAGNEKLLTGTLTGHGFLAIGWSNRLNKGGDVVRIIKIADNSVENEMTYGSEGGVCVPDPESNQSIGRFENGNTIERFETYTKGVSNTGAILYPCPTPSPDPTEPPTDSPTDTPTDSPASTPSPTKSPTPKATVKAASTKKPRRTSDPNEKSGEEIVLGLREGLEDPSPSPEGEEEEEGKISVPAVILIIMGIGFIGVAGYSFYVQKNKGYTKGDEGKEPPIKKIL